MTRMEIAICICLSSGGGEDVEHLLPLYRILGEKRGFAGSPSCEQQLFNQFKFVAKFMKKLLLFF
jgi:hypothetical protein